MIFGIKFNLILTIRAVEHAHNILLLLLVCWPDHCHRLLREPHLNSLDPADHIAQVQSHPRVDADGPILLQFALLKTGHDLGPVFADIDIVHIGGCDDEFCVDLGDGRVGNGHLVARVSAYGVFSDVKGHLLGLAERALVPVRNIARDFRLRHYLILINRQINLLTTFQNICLSFIGPPLSFTRFSPASLQSTDGCINGSGIFLQQFDMSQLDKQIEQLRRGEIISELEVKHLCSKAREILVEEGNVQRVDSPVTICGDIHGQFYDLLELFKNGGDIPGVCYLFLGDFVDRGFNSVETFLLLLAYKVRYPDLVTLIRGNHECRQITQVYGFYDECLRKYGSLNVWRYCTDVFDYLSLAAIIDDSIFCVHGGLSPSINDSIDEIRSIDRKQEIPHDGSMCDLMWSDPDDISGWVLSPRGAGYLFGANVVESFNHTNKITEIVRAHQLIMEGYKEMFNKQLVTVWSAPNYCYRCNNIASILVLDDKLNQKFIKFEAATHESRVIPAKKAIPEYFL